MRIIKKAKRCVLAAMSLSCLGYSQEVSILEENGQERIVAIDETDRFWDVIAYLEHYAAVQELGTEGTLGQSSGLRIELTMDATGVKIKSFDKNMKTRNYNVLVSPQEKKDIRHVVTTLANSSLASIATSRSSLKRAGDRIKHVHPLRFLLTIFSDEELKAGVHGIRDRGWIWDEFLGGLVGSLNEESANQNMKIEFVQDFSGQLGVNINFILPLMQGGLWKDFVNFLIDYIPRANNPNRYNM